MTTWSDTQSDARPASRAARATSTTASGAIAPACSSAIPNRGPAIRLSSFRRSRDGRAPAPCAGARRERPPGTSGGDRRLAPPEGELAVLVVQDHRVAVVELAPQQAHRQRLDDLLLDRALQRSRAVDRVEPLAGQELARRRGQLEVHLTLGQPRPQA